MEGYTSLKDAVISVENTTEKWKNVMTGEIFDKKELLQMGDTYDGLFAPDGWNYFVTFPTGEIGLLSTNDNEIMLFLVPEGSTMEAKPAHEAVIAAEPAAEGPAPAPKAQPKFCTSCGARLKAGARFCTECGSRVS